MQETYVVIICGDVHPDPIEWEYEAHEYGDALDQYHKKCTDHIMSYAEGAFMVQLRRLDNGSSIVLRKLDMISEHFQR